MPITLHQLFIIFSILSRHSFYCIKAAGRSWVASWAVAFENAAGRLWPELGFMGSHKTNPEGTYLTMKGIGTHLPDLKTAAHGERFFSRLRRQILPA